MTLTLRLSPADAALIRQYATEKGLSMSNKVYLIPTKYGIFLVFFR